VTAQSVPNVPIRVALVGCGAISQSLHLPVLAGHEGIRLTALVDRARDRAEQLAKGYGVPIVVSDAAELNSNTVDAAIIATPAAHHAPGAIDLMRRGIHVLVEKPMALTARDAEEMVRVADETDRRLAVGYFRRLYPSLRLMKALVDRKFFGEPRRVHAEGGGRYSWAAATLANMRRDLAGGGVLIDYGSHILDMLFYLFDESAEVLSYQDNDLGGVEADCIIDVRLSHRGQAVDGRIELARTRELGNSISVECDEGRLLFEFFAYDQAFLGGVRVACRDVNGDGVPDIITAPGPGGPPMIRAFDGRTQQRIFEFAAFDPFFVGGAFVASR